MTLNDPWTDRLSDYLDDELPDDERRAVAAHLAGCAECSNTLAELQRVAAAAASLAPERPRADLWSGIAARIGSTSLADRTGFAARGPYRFSLSLSELAAASLLAAALAGGTVAILMTRPAEPGAPRDATASAAIAPGAARPDLPGVLARLEPVGEPVSAAVAVGFADAQYDAAVADLEQAMENGRSRVDGTTFSVIEQSLSIVDRAIAEARSALAADPSNSYLSGHLMEARRRKLALLRRAAALTTETN
jgi:putative zinc finger protein